MFVKVKAFPGASSERVIREKTRLLIYIKDQARNGAANMRIGYLVAQELGVPLHTVCLVSGHRSQNKTFQILHR